MLFSETMKNISELLDNNEGVTMTFVVTLILITTPIVWSLTQIAIRRTHEYLLYLQQDEYAPSRFMKWFTKNKAFDKKITLTAIVFIIIDTVLYHLISNNIEKIFSPFIHLICFMLFTITTWNIIKKEEDPATSGSAKIPLNLTFRARRIKFLSLSYFVILYCFFIKYLFINITTSFLLTALSFQFIPFLLTLAVISLSPFEKRTRNKYLNEAKTKFSEINPFVVAVVGSYGKSTVKNMLGEILEASKGHTFWPKAGINTIMGITRKIREELKVSDKYAVIEMGTYKKGSISNVCSLTPPKAAILTAINYMHLERFKTRENIYEAKTEVVKALPKDGILVCNADDDFVLRAYNEANVEHKYLYGLEKNDNLNAYLTDIKYSAHVTSAKIYWKNECYNIKTKVVGRGGLSSLLASFTMACAMGVEPKIVVDIIANIEPLSNRLVLKEYGNNLLYLEDGYNSNPLGFNSALDVLKELDVQRRIVMTPGIIELGEAQFYENYKIAKKICTICDKIIFVGTENKDAYEKAFNEEGFSNVSFVKNREEGFKVLTEYQKSGDGILIENDLPDWYESKINF